MKIQIIETKFDKRTSSEVMRAIGGSMAARSKCAEAQKSGDKPRQAELHINNTHVANVAVWGGSDIADSKFYGVPTEAFWDIWNESKDEVKSHRVFVETSNDEWTVGRYA